MPNKKPNKANNQPSLESGSKKNELSASEVKALERKIQKLEHEISRTENSFAEIVFGTPKFNDAQQKLTDLKKELEVALREWENSQT